jgi:hypothetical protein
VGGPGLALRRIARRSLITRSFGGKTPRVRKRVFQQNRPSLDTRLGLLISSIADVGYGRDLLRRRLRPGIPRYAQLRQRSCKVLRVILEAEF